MTNMIFGSLLDDMRLATGMEAAAFTNTLLLILTIIIVFVVLYVVCIWKIFEKAGEEGWKSLIPIYNKYVLVDIAGLNWWWFLIWILPTVLSGAAGSNSGVSYILSIVTLLADLNVNYNIAKKIHKDAVYAILMVLFPVIMYPIIAFSKDIKFDNTVKVSRNGLFKDDVGSGVMADNVTPGSFNNTNTQNQNPNQTNAQANTQTNTQSNNETQSTNQNTNNQNPNA